MNSVQLLGRLTADPRISYTQGQEPMCVARYTLAVDRLRKDQNGQNQADFISCVAFRNVAQFAERYLHKGSKIAVTGSIQTGSYTDRNGNKVYTTDVIINSQEFAESRQQAQNAGYQAQPNNYQPQQNQGQYAPQNAPQQAYQQQYQQAPQTDYQQAGFMDIPDDVNDAGLPWN